MRHKFCSCDICYRLFPHCHHQDDCHHQMQCTSQKTHIFLATISSSLRRTQIVTGRNEERIASFPVCVCVCERRLMRGAQSISSRMNRARDLRKYIFLFSIYIICVLFISFKLCYIYIIPQISAAKISTASRGEERSVTRIAV